MEFGHLWDLSLQFKRRVLTVTRSGIELLERASPARLIA